MTWREKLKMKPIISLICIHRRSHFWRIARAEFWAFEKSGNREFRSYIESE